MSETLHDLEDRSRRLRQRIAELRIDYPEAADARRDELATLEEQIAKMRGEGNDAW